MATANITDKRYDLFLAELAVEGNVSRSANAAGVDRSNAYQRRLKNPEFSRRWDGAIEAATDTIEAEARRRAVEGVEEPVYYKGQECGRIRRYSDSLLLALLRAKRPQEYRDSGRVEIANAPGENLKVDESPIAVARKIAFALSVGLRAKQQQDAEIAQRLLNPPRLEGNS